MFPVKICEIHSLGRYSREVLIGHLHLSHPRDGHAEKRGKSLPARLEFILLLSGAESATGKATEYQLYRIRNWCSAHWRTESLSSVLRKSNNDGVSERREKLQGAPLSGKSWRGVFLFAIERTFRLFFQNSLDKLPRI